MKIQISKHALKLFIILFGTHGMFGMNVNFEEDFSGDFISGDQYISYAWNACCSFFKRKQVQNAAKAASYTVTNPAGAVCDVSSMAWHSGKKVIVDSVNQQMDKAQAFVQVKVEETKAHVQDQLDAQIATQITPIKLKTIKYVKIGTGLALGGMALYYTAKFAAKKIEEFRRIPRLAYASSELTFAEQCKSIVGRSQAVSKFPVILSSKNSAKFIEIADLTKKITSQIVAGKSLQYRNLLLSGPSGTGKSLFAQNLAIDLAMDYYMFNAAVFLDDQRDQKVHALGALVAWAEGASSRGRLVFIDDAHLLFAKSHEAAVQQFLEYLRSGSSRTMFVLVTNKEIVGANINACVEDVVIFALPDTEARVSILNQYIDQYLLDDGINPVLRDSVLAVLQQDKVRQIAQATENFSGESLKNFVKTIVTLSTSQSVIVTNEMVDEVLRKAKEKNKQLACNS